VKEILERKEKDRKTQEVNLVQKMDELWVKLKKKIEYIKKLKAQIEKLERSTKDMRMKLHREQMSKGDIPSEVELGIGDGLGGEDGTMMDSGLIFGTEWFEEDQSYDLTELR